jgi:putative Mn2+ efflux pump MntP
MWEMPHTGRAAARPGGGNMWGHVRSFVPRHGPGAGRVLKLVALVLPLAVDSFTVAAALGASGVTPRERRRVAATFAAFEAAMPLVGLGLGSPVGHALGSPGDFLASGLLVGLGLYYLLGSDDPGEGDGAPAMAAARGWRVTALAVAVSLDELAIGFSFGALRVAVLPALILIAVQAVVASHLGLRFGRVMTAALRERAETLAGLWLIAIGLAVALQRIA